MHRASTFLHNAWKVEGQLLFASFSRPKACPFGAGYQSLSQAIEEPIKTKEYAHDKAPSAGIP